MSPSTGRTVVAAPDKFRGTATAAQVCRAVARGAAEAGWATLEVPLSDGGDGLLEVLAEARSGQQATGGGRSGSGGDGDDVQWLSAPVVDPLGRPVEAAWLRIGDVAVIEMARASGLALVGGADGNDAVAASTRGTGELVVAAARQLSVHPPASHRPATVVVGLGGSATTDGGRGMVAAIEEAGGLGGVTLVGACDVDTSFVDAAAVFGPQKGADRAQVSVLAHRLSEAADRFEERYGVDVRSVPGGGAAGGTGGAIVAVGGQLRSGYRVVADLVGLPDALGSGHLVVTGEGALDDTSFSGKVTGSVVQDARDRGLPVLIVAGRVEDRAGRRAEQLGARVVSLTERFGGPHAAADTESCIARVVAEELDSRPRG